jgi:hypothetical protein
MADDTAGATQTMGDEALLSCPTRPARGDGDLSVGEGKLKVAMTKARARESLTGASEISLDAQRRRARGGSDLSVGKLEGWRSHGGSELGG